MFGELCSANVDFRNDLIRNIKAIREPRDAFDDLSDDPADWAVARVAEAEGRVSVEASVIARAFDHGTVIACSFDPANWQATRLSDGRRYGVWYGSLNVETTIHETVFHWHRFLTDSYAGEDREVAGERVVFDVRCDALLVDLRGKEAGFPDLASRTSYAFTQSLGAYLFDQGANGLLVNSARGDGWNSAILKPERLSNVREKMRLTYRCNPARDRCVVENARGDVLLNIVPSTLY